MTKPDWPSIKRDYVETAMTLAEVAAKWGLRRGTLSARATRERWRYQRQLFAAKLAQIREEKILAKTAEKQAKFQSNVVQVVSAQLALIVRQMQEPGIDTAKLLKLTNALANVQRIGITAHGIGTGRVGAAPDEAADA
jgi:uncharacterized protein YjcR